MINNKFKVIKEFVLLILLYNNLLSEEVLRKNKRVIRSLWCRGFVERKKGKYYVTFENIKKFYAEELGQKIEINEDCISNIISDDKHIYLLDKSLIWR